MWASRVARLGSRKIRGAGKCRSLQVQKENRRGKKTPSNDARLFALYRRCRSPLPDIVRDNPKGNR